MAMPNLPCRLCCRCSPRPSLCRLYHASLRGLLKSQLCSAGQITCPKFLNTEFAIQHSQRPRVFAHTTFLLQAADSARPRAAARALAGGCRVGTTSLAGGRCGVQKSRQAGLVAVGRGWRPLCRVRAPGWTDTQGTRGRCANCWEGSAGRSACHGAQCREWSLATTVG